MVSGPTSIQSTPVMHYRPDPGEPAVSLAAKEPQTAGLVTLQEQRNETRLLMRAMAQGDDVIYSKRTFSLGLGSSSPTYNGGLTTVVSKPDQNGFLPDSVVQAQTPQNTALQEEDPNSSEETGSQDEDSQSVSGENNLQSANQPTQEELDQEKQDIDTEDRQIERNLLRAQLEKDRAYQNNNPTQVQQADRKEAELERKMDENDADKRKVEQERLQQQQEQFQQTTGDILAQNVAAATSILGALFGGGSQEPQFSSNRSTTPDVPQFSFAG